MFWFVDFVACFVFTAVFWLLVSVVVFDVCLVAIDFTLLIVLYY